MPDPFQFTFANGRTASAVRVHRAVELSAALSSMGLAVPRPTLVMLGGAGKMSEDDLIGVRHLFGEVLAPQVEALGGCVVDGGTDAGIMRIMGEAREETGGTFPLIGVAPVGRIALPAEPPDSDDSVPLEPRHTHFILVPGSRFGDKSPWLARIATAIAGGQATVAILINGGEISWEDVKHNVAAGRTVIAMDGSGRAADGLAAACRGEAVPRRARLLAATGRVRALDLMAEPDTLAGAIREALMSKE